MEPGLRPENRVLLAEILSNVPALVLLVEGGVFLSLAVGFRFLQKARVRN